MNEEINEIHFIEEFIMYFKSTNAGLNELTLKP
jgi:hypothetical protein